MKTLGILLALICYLPSTVFSSQISIEKKDLINDLLELQGGNYIGEELAFNLVNQQRSLFREKGMQVDEKYFTALMNITSEVVYEELVFNGKLEEMSHKIWGLFSTKELQELIHFYKQPVGQKLLHSVPEITDNSMSQGLEFEKKISQKIELRLKQRLKEIGFDMNSLSKNLGRDKNYPSDKELAELTAAKCSAPLNDDKRLPIYRGTPNYPIFARMYRIEGFVDIQFDILPDGGTTNPKVLKASVGTILNDAAINSVNNYKYCKGELSKNQSIRIRFTLSDRDSPKKHNNNQKNKDEFTFLKAKNFSKYLEAYKSKAARKALAVAYDSNGEWDIQWQYNHRSQDDANNSALKKCEQSRRKKRIKSKCELLFFGHELGNDFKGKPKFEELKQSLQRKGYENISYFESSLIAYRNNTGSKALAISENADRSYYFSSAFRHRTQKNATEAALKSCNEAKPDKFTNKCHILMVGDYPVDELPQLEMMTGVWEGLVQSIETKSGTTTLEPVKYKLKLDNCGDHPIIYFYDNNTDESYMVNKIFDIKQEANNAMLSSVKNREGKVETEIWTLMKLNDEEASIQHNHMFDKLKLTKDNNDKSSHHLGVGTLIKSKLRCK